jgi:hypothetical protein
LQDGRVAKFAQNDATAIQKIVEHIQPNRLFAQHHLVLGGDQTMTAIQCSHIVRVDLVADNLPQWPFHHGVLDVKEISDDEFFQRYDPEHYANLFRQGAPAPGTPLVAFAEAELTSGERVFMELQVQAQERTPMDVGVLLQQIFSAAGLHARRRGGGVAILNPANIVRFTLYPGPQVLPPNAWHASRLPI